MALSFIEVARVFVVVVYLIHVCSRSSSRSFQQQIVNCIDLDLEESVQRANARGRIDGSMDGCISQQPLPFRQAGSFSHIAVFVVVWRSGMGYWGVGW